MPVKKKKETLKPKAKPNKAGVLVATGKDILAGLNKALSSYKVAALTRKQDRILYDLITNGNEVVLEYSPTVLSPKKFFFPQEEVILDYTSGGKVQPRIKAQPLVLFGMRPCDLNGLKIMDEAFADSKGDPNYLAKREKAVIIGIDCKELCDEHAFCYRVRSNCINAGYDIMLTEVNGKYVVQPATKKGKAFTVKYFAAKTGSKALLEKYAQEKQKGFSKVPPFAKLHQFPELFEKNQNHLIWEETASRCLSCGSCIMVCPTCYCFDVADELALNLQHGQRLRRWDACMVSPFAVVASGENFRKTAKARLKHRINRKFNYLMKKHGQAVCVGCGRCVRACLAEISPKQIAKVISGEIDK